MFVAVDKLTSLALAAAQGDNGAREALVRTTYPEVHRFCASLVGWSGAEDVAQESFVRVVRALKGFRAESSARTWILSIARYTCMDELRRRYRARQRDEPATALEGFDEPVEHGAGDSAMVSDLLARLAPERRAAFVLTQEIGLSYAEAAAVCGCPVGTMRSRVARARGDLIALLAAPAGGEQLSAGYLRARTARSQSS